MKKFIWLSIICLLLTLTLSSSNLLAAISSHPQNNQNSKQPSNPANSSAVAKQVKPLPIVGSLGKLKELLAQAEQKRSALYNYRDMGMVDVAETVKTQAPKEKAESSPVTNGSDFSGTNIQVQGVDEADVVKTDGKYLYKVNGSKVLIISAYPGDEMKLIKSLQFNPEFAPVELYVDSKHLIIIGNNYSPFKQEKPLKQEMPDQAKQKKSSSSPLPDSSVPELYPPESRINTIKTLIYDISNKSQIQMIREVEMEGQYISSRKIGSALYLVANKNFDTYRIMQEETTPTPLYRDLSGKSLSVDNAGVCSSVQYKDISYFPNSIEPNYLMIAGLDLNQPEKKLAISTYLGAGESIYASEENLYVAVSQFDQEQMLPAAEKLQEVIMPVVTNTSLYKFALDKGQTTYQGQGEVPGTILNQFSMDENNGHLRIATTRNKIGLKNSTSTNNLYILDKEMQISGRIEDIAPGEKIYSVRFIGNRGYMVTFKTVDPLFVLDLADPKAPKILGALKIPGYSDYLHPYDENHLIGFGKDTVELAAKDSEGNVINTSAYYQGMKIALFDVTDVNNPVEEYKEIIGDRGTDSELLRNHRALLFSKDKSLLAFPVTVMEVQKKQNTPEAGLEYGTFTFQGAYIYQLDLATGFQLKGKLTHLNKNDLLKAGQYWQGSSKDISRILYINDTLYTISDSMIKAVDIKSLQLKGRLTIQ